MYVVFQGLMCVSWPEARSSLKKVLNTSLIYTGIISYGKNDVVFPSSSVHMGTEKNVYFLCDRKCNGTLECNIQ